MNKFLLPIIILLVVAGAVVGGVFLSKQEKPQGEILDSTIQEGERQLGNPQASVELIEYGDFQCPACASYDPMIRKLMEENSDWINFSYRHLPLKQIHPNATKAAQAAEAADLQGKFWEYKAMLFDKQTEWASMIDPMPKFVEYANALEMDQNRFVADVDSNQVHLKVDSDYRTAVASGFNSTPTFVVNGQKVSLPANYEQIVSFLQQIQQ